MDRDPANLIPYCGEYRRKPIARVDWRDSHLDQEVFYCSEGQADVCISLN